MNKKSETIAKIINFFGKKMYFNIKNKKVNQSRIKEILNDDARSELQGIYSYPNME